MKYRMDFVTNSSSSSYVVVYEIDSDYDEKDIKEEYGNYGLRLFSENLISGKNKKEIEDILVDEYGLENDEFEIEDNKFYLFGRRISYSENLMIVDKILPNDKYNLVYEGDSY